MNISPQKIFQGLFKPTSLSGPFLLLFILGCITYANSITHPFVHDDVVFIETNPHIQQLDIKEAFLRESAVGGKSAIVNLYYRPFLDVLYQVQYKIFKLNPFKYHAFNVFVHILNSFLVFLMLHSINYGRRRLFSLSVAIFFLVHPIQTEAVACIAGVSNLMFGFFCLLSFVFYLQAHQIPVSLKRTFLYSSSLLVFLLGLFAKEQSIILPALIFLYEFTMGRRRYAGRIGASRLFKIAGYCLVVGFYFLWRKFILGGVIASKIQINQEFWLRILAIPKTLLMYLRTFLAPYDLHYYRSVDVLQPFETWLILFVFLLLVGFILFEKGSRELKPIVTFGAGFFIISLLPVLNIVPLITEYSWILTSEHFLYLPSIGFFVFIFGYLYFLLERFLKQKTFKFSTIVFSILICLCMVGSIRQNHFWKDEITLFERTLKYEDLGRVRILLAKAYYAERRYHDAIREGQKAISTFDQYLKKSKSIDANNIYRGFLKGAHFDIAHSYSALGNVNTAVVHYKEAIDIDPFDSILYNNLGLSYIVLSQVDQAIASFQRAIEYNKTDTSAMNNLAICYLEIGENLKAQDMFSQILKIKPQDFMARRNLRQLQSEN